MQIVNFFNTIIIVMIVMGFLASFLCVHLFIKKRKEDKTLSILVYKIFAGIFFLGTLFILYGSYTEPYRIVVKEEEINLCRTDVCSLIRVGLIADTHVGPYTHIAHLDRIAARINSLDPDVTVFPGDLVAFNSEQLSLLEPLSAIVSPLYVTLGNHDHDHTEQHGSIPASDRTRSSEITELFPSILPEAQLLRDEITYIQTPGGTMRILGQNDWWYTYKKNLVDFDDRRFHQAHDLSMLIQHNPDGAFDQDISGVDVVVSGHTHGGQIRLPIVGSAWPLPTEAGRQYDQGLFKINKDGNPVQYLMITSGIGMVGPRARTFNPPEIVILDIYVDEER